MSRFARDVLIRLCSGHQDRVREGVEMAVSLFEAAEGRPDPWHTAATTDPTVPAELDAVRDALIEVVDRPPAPDLVGAALFALGKRNDRSLVPFFVRWLVRHRSEDPAAAHQALIGLNNHGEPTLSLESQLSIADPALTLRQADHYLREIGAI